MKLSGTGGAIQTGSRQSAAVERWQLTRIDAETCRAELTLGHVDTYWWTQDDQRVSVSIGKRIWTWPLDLPAASNTITVALKGEPVIS